MHVRQFIGSILFALLLCIPAFAQQTKVKVTGTFTSLEYNEEGGDLLGIEVFVFVAGDYMVLYQESVGEPVQPSLVKAKVNGDSIEFTVPDLLCGKKIFKGKITKSNMVGKWVGSKETIKLPRRNSYWQ